MVEYKYNEDQIMKDVAEYIQSTYGQHYVGNRDIQTVDVWDSLGIAGQMSQGTAIKYLMRFCRKDGVNRKDLMKAMHYIILLTHFTDKERESQR